MGLARNAFYLNNLLVGSRGATSRCSFVYLRFILHSSVLFHASIWLRTPHTPVGNPIWTHIYVTIRLFIIAPPSISMPLTNPSVSNFNFMQLSQVPNKTISDKSFSHLSRSDGSLPAAHLVARRGVWSFEQLPCGYISTRPKLLFQGSMFRRHSYFSFNSICFFSFLSNRLFSYSYVLIDIISSIGSFAESLKYFIIIP